MKRNLAVALVAVAVVLGGGVGWAITRIDHHSGKPSHAGGQTPPQVRIVDYVTKANPDGLSIDTPAKVTELTGTTAAFKQFVATQVQTMMDDQACKASVHTVDVNAYAANGYALGGVSDCGGYRAIWGVRDGLWKSLISTQDTWYCADLHKYAVPKGLIADGTCYDQASGKVVPYPG